MFRLSNISIRVKSLTVFSTIVAVILALGLFSLSRLSAVNDQAGVIRDRWLPGVGQVANVFIAFEHYRTIEGAVVMSSSVSEVAEEAEHLKTVEKDLADEIEKARAYLQSDEERALFGDFAAVQEKYRKLSQEKVIMYARMNDSAAADVFKGESREAFESARGVLRRLMDGQAQGGATAANRGEAIYHGAATLIYLVAALGLAIAVFGAWLIAATAIRPVRALTGLMGSLADGRLDIAITGRERADEVGDMARALHVFKEAAHEKQRLDAAERAQRAAEAERAANLNGLIRNFETVIGEVVAGVAAASGDLGRTAESMASLAEQTNHQAAASAAAAEQTAANVQTVAAASEEMGASIAEISRQVVRSNAVSAQAGSEAKSTAATVDGLVEAVGKIDEVVKLIQNIASQTNLLALNATIEAARAGEAGKGFAVVAGEVKALANQTAGATVEIAQQIAGIQASTQGTVAAIQRIVATIADLNDIAASIASAIEEQNATTGEITRNVQEAARGTQEVSANVAQVNAAATETGSAAGRVLDASGGLSKQADVLRGEVEAFLSGIRAA